MESIDEPGRDPAPNAFDDLLDHLLRGEPVDVGRFLEDHPELSVDERRQVLALTGAASGGNPPPRSDPVPVDRIGGFRLIRKIGAGSTGAVYLAEDESLGRTVALKLLGPDIVGSGERRERFVREARAVAKLRHPNIVAVHAAGEADGLRYIAMEYLPGSGLHEVVEAAAARGTLPPVRDVLRWGADLSRALECAHRAGIVHRDVKPSNVRIAEDGRAVLLDFGIAREAEAATLTESGDFRGSPQYASPEQVGLENTPVDARTDVYSLGVTLYELLTGAPPFRATTREQLFHQILDREPLPPRRIESSLPRDLETVVLATLEKDPVRRHASAAALAADLEAVRDGRPVSVRPISRFGRMVRWARRQPAKAALVSGVVVLIPVVAALGGYIAANLPTIRKAADDERARDLARILENGFIEYGEGEPSRARLLFEDALRVDPGSAEAKAGFALAQIERGDSEGAISFLDGPAGDSSSGWSAAIRSEAWRRRGRAAETRSLTMNPAPSTAVDHFVLGIIGLMQVHRGEEGAASEAFDRLQEAVVSAPSPTALYHFELGHAAWHAGRHKDARMIAAAIERRWPESPERAYAIGRTLFEADREAALEAFEKAARSPPRSAQARLLIAKLLSDGEAPAGRARAISIARELVAQQPLLAVGHGVLGVALLNDQQVEDAIESLRESVRLDPSHVGTHRVLSQGLCRDRKLPEALVSARESVRLSPDAWQSWGCLGFVLLELGEIEEAITSYERAVTLNPRAATFLCNLGLAHFRNGDFDKALARVKEGQAVGSKDPRWKDRSKDRIPDIEDRIRMESRLTEVRNGTDEPPTASERIALAGLICIPKQLFSEAAELYSKAFDVEPTLKSAGDPHHVLEAAECAVAAGLGKGRDAPADAARRGRLLAQARAWIDEEAAAVEEALRRQPLRGEASARRFRSWISHPTLAATRSLAPTAVGDAEAASWGALWSRIDAAVSRPAPSSRTAVPPVSR